MLHHARNDILLNAMAAKILDGKALSESVLSELKNKVDKALSTKRRPPGLAVILVGENPASAAYVGSKTKAAKKCGFQTFDAKLSEDCSFQDVAQAIEKFNKQPDVDGILLQLPLPAGLDSAKLIELIDPKKDADGLHPVNQGLLMAGSLGPRPCTPKGAMRLLESAGLNDLSGKRAVVLGRSVLVGKPVALMLLEKNATVTMAHSRTANLAQICAEADVLIAAVGKPLMVKADFVKPGACVIDVGINRLSSGPQAGKLVGDVDFEAVLEKVSAITPVPGGVGPMTVAMLIENTFEAWI